jgi:hypothetical protein
MSQGTVASDLACHYTVISVVYAACVYPQHYPYHVRIHSTTLTMCVSTALPLPCVYPQHYPYHVRIHSTTLTWVLGDIFFLHRQQLGQDAPCGQHVDYTVISVVYAACVYPQYYPYLQTTCRLPRCNFSAER